MIARHTCVRGQTEMDSASVEVRYCDVLARCARGCGAQLVNARQSTGHVGRQAMDAPQQFLDGAHGPPRTRTRQSGQCGDAQQQPRSSFRRLKTTVTLPATGFERAPPYTAGFKGSRGLACTAYRPRGTARPLSNQSHRACLPAAARPVCMQHRRSQQEAASATSPRPWACSRTQTCWGARATYPGFFLRHREAKPTKRPPAPQPHAPRQAE